jgi:hypothetical protein
LTDSTHRAIASRYRIHRTIVGLLIKVGRAPT